MAAVSGDEHPGPQKKVTTRSIFRSPIHWLILLAFLATVFAVVQANMNVEADTSFWSLEFIDIDTSVTLLAATVSLLYARNQFEQGIMPILDYRIGYTSKPALGFTSSDNNSKLLVCSLKNHSAVAVVTAVKYTLQVDGKQPIECEDYHELIKRLGSFGLQNKVDYSMLYVSKGWSLGANDERVIFELKTDSWPNSKGVTGIDLTLKFRSLLGDIYEKGIYCVPRRGVNV